jgi:hypothetical protein
MHPMARRWPGHGPWDEVWFVEVSLGDGHSVWLRYVLGDGPHRRGLATWAIATLPGGLLADQGHHDLAGLRPDRPVAHGDTLWLDAPDPAHLRPGEEQDGHARGTAGAAAWDLTLHVAPRTHRMVPGLVERLGVGRTYVPALLDLHVSGEVRIGGERLQLDRAPAVLGHIWGASNRTTAWAWCHAHLPDDDVLFEGLSVRLGRLPLLTTLGVWIGDEHIDLSRARHLVRTRSHLSADRWSFEARRRGVTLSGEARLPAPDRVAPVRYLDPGDGQIRGCRNSGGARLELTVEQPSGTRRYVIDTAAFEVATLGEPQEAVLLSD